MHIAFLIAWAALIIILVPLPKWVTIMTPETIDVTSTVTAIAAVVSAFAALAAAIFLYRTLQETKTTTRLMNDQLRQNRAYMTPDIIDILSTNDGQGNITGVGVRINWKNTGGSPAFNVKAQSQSASTFVSELENLPPCDAEMPIRTFGSVVAMGHRLMGAHNVFQLPGIEAPMPEGACGVIRSFCTYTDIYGEEYKSEYSGFIEWHPNILDPALTLQIIEHGLEIKPYGEANRILKVSE